MYLKQCWWCLYCVVHPINFPYHLSTKLNQCNYVTNFPCLPASCKQCCLIVLWLIFFLLHEPFTKLSLVSESVTGKLAITVCARRIVISMLNSMPLSSKCFAQTGYEYKAFRRCSCIFTSVNQLHCDKWIQWLASSLNFVKQTHTSLIIRTKLKEHETCGYKTTFNNYEHI